MCTLACCKPIIRRTASEKDYIIGIAGKKLANKVGSLVYLMKVDKIVSYKDYWEDKEFDIKKPNEENDINYVGDNIYRPANAKMHRKRFLIVENLAFMKI